MFHWNIQKYIEEKQLFTLHDKTSTKNTHKPLDIFWLFEVFRSPSYKAYERFDNGIMHDTDRNFVVWMKEGEYKFMELQSIESPQKEMDKMLSSKFNYLLPKEDF